MKTFLDQYKIINLAFFAIVGCIWLYTVYYYRSGLCAENCTFEFMVGILDPIKAGSLYLLPTLALFLALPSHYFRRWLWYIASWALPLSVYLVLSESVYTTALFSGRTFFAETTMRILFMLSLVFVAGVFAWGWYQRRSRSR